MLATNTRKLGSSHSNTLKELVAYANFLDNNDESKAARPLYEQAIRGFRDVLGPSHGSTVDAMLQYARLLGDVAAARDAMCHDIRAAAGPP